MIDRGAANTRADATRSMAKRNRPPMKRHWESAHLSSDDFPTQGKLDLAETTRGCGRFARGNPAVAQMVFSPANPTPTLR